MLPVDSVPYGTYIKAYAKRITKNPLDTMSSAKSVIVVAKVTTYDEDVYKTTFVTNGYKGYKNIYDSSRQLEAYIKSLGVAARVEHDLDQKSCAINAGLGWRGKNTLVINERYGTHLRFDTIVTDFEFSDYSHEVTNACGECSVCIKACPHGCYSTGSLDRDMCFRKYLPRKRMNIIQAIPMCAICQVGCPYNNEEIG